MRRDLDAIEQAFTYYKQQQKPVSKQLYHYIKILTREIRRFNTLRIGTVLSNFIDTETQDFYQVKSVAADINQNDVKLHS